MKRKILLIEPNYKNKYPPIGLMKLSTYHKSIGDEVRFFKGNLNDIVLEIKLSKCLEELTPIKLNENHELTPSLVETYLKTRRLSILSCIILLFPNDTQKQVERILKYYAFKYVPTDYWDRIYITTLFTFYWKITVQTINFAKNLVSDHSKIYVGGVMASLLKNEIIEETGIVPLDGLLDKPGVLDDNNQLIIDELVLDYSILYEIDYDYPAKSAYFTFMTKGCTRKCAFCSVPKLEPTYKNKIESIEKFKEVNEIYGEQRNLLLMDNNVLASPKFAEIIQEIKDMGFYKGATFTEPNQLDIAIKNLQKGINDKAYIKRSFQLIKSFFEKLIGQNQVKVKDILIRYQILKFDSTTKRGLINAYFELKDMYEKHRPKRAVPRFVDFNQGTDARYITDELMKLISEIPIKPLRIAFDHIGIQKQYIKSVELASKYGIKELSNYILFNFHDKPEDFYNRLRINIELGKRLNINIFSFPMKFIPLFGEEAKDRKYIGEHWNRKFLRAIQSILNATKGIVAPGYDFFENAFGKNLEEFKEILFMPEQYIMNRKYCLNAGITQQWREDFDCLDAYEKVLAKEIIHVGEFKNIEESANNPKILNFLSHYTQAKLSIIEADQEIKKMRAKYNALIRKDIFKNLTLTYDFDGS